MFPDLDTHTLIAFFKFLSPIPMLTKFANKVYLLGYNACETPSFSAFKAGF